jgi:hypothetical protein
LSLKKPSHTCRRCGGPLHKIHRRWWQKLVYRSIYECDACHEQQVHRRNTVRTYFATGCRCPRCWSEDLKVFKKRDHIEGFQKSFLRRIQGWLGAPLYYCSRCRLQFYDVRPRRKGATDTAPLHGSESS